jgi:hypothetical protein
MSGTALRAAFTSLAVLLFVSSDAFAAAPKKEECISAFDAGQRARREGHLKQSHESLVVCSQKECPSVLRADCSDVLRQVDDAQPSIVLGASDASGKDLTDVTVELDGTPLVTELNGRAILVDPGKLALVFERPPWDPVTVDVVIKEGEKGRSVRATLGPPASTTPAPPAATKPVPVRPEETPPRSVLGYAVPGTLAALGLAALTYAGVTSLEAGNDADGLKSTCGPICPESDRDSLSSDLVRANASFAIGVGLVVLAATSWFILGPRRP